MDPNPDTSRNRIRKWLVTGAIAGGVALGAAGIASAATTGNSGAAGSPSSGATATATAPDPAAMSHGPGETLLTGTTAAKVKAAALAAVPGATVIRVETDSQGSAYEAHLKKSDGTTVTVKLDSAFKVTTTESGFGGGPGGGSGAPGGQPPAGAAASTSGVNA